MAIIPTVEPQGPRIGPRVFADVPRQEDVLAAQAQVSQARSRAFAFFAALLVAVGAAAALGFLYTDAMARVEGQKPELEKMEAAHKVEIGTLQTQIKALESRNSALERQYAGFFNLKDKAAEVAQVRERIANIAAQDTKKGVLRVRSFAADAAVYNRPSKLEANLKAAEADLDAELNALRRLERNTDNWTAPPVAPGPPCGTEVGCAPGSTQN